MAATLLIMQQMQRRRRYSGGGGGGSPDDPILIFIVMVAGIVLGIILVAIIMAQAATESNDKILTPTPTSVIEITLTPDQMLNQTELRCQNITIVSELKSEDANRVYEECLKQFSD